jgi:hypothetical protein
MLHASVDLRLSRTVIGPSSIYMDMRERNYGGRKQTPTGINSPDEDRVPEEAESELESQSNEGDGERSISIILSRPQSISSSSMGTSRVRRSCASGLAGMLAEHSMDTSKHTDNLLTSFPVIHTDEGRLNIIRGTLGDERENDESVIALVVPFGVVRVKTPGFICLNPDRLFRGDIALSSFVNSSACMLMTFSDGL